MFRDEAEGRRAVGERDRQYIGERFVELALL